MSRGGDRAGEASEGLALRQHYGRRPASEVRAAAVEKSQCGSVGAIRMQGTPWLEPMPPMWPASESSGVAAGNGAAEHGGVFMW